MLFFFWRGEIAQLLLNCRFFPSLSCQCCTDYPKHFLEKLASWCVSGSCYTRNPLKCLWPCSYSDMLVAWGLESKSTTGTCVAWLLWTDVSFVFSDFTISSNREQIISPIVTLSPLCRNCVNFSQSILFASLRWIWIRSWNASYGENVVRQQRSWRKPALLTG